MKRIALVVMFSAAVWPAAAGGDDVCVNGRWHKLVRISALQRGSFLFDLADGSIMGVPVEQVDQVVLPRLKKLSRAEKLFADGKHDQAARAYDAVGDEAVKPWHKALIQARLARLRPPVIKPAAKSIALPSELEFVTQAAKCKTSTAAAAEKLLAAYTARLEKTLAGLNVKADDARFAAYRLRMQLATAKGIYAVSGPLARLLCRKATNDDRRRIEAATGAAVRELSELSRAVSGELAKARTSVRGIAATVAALEAISAEMGYRLGWILYYRIVTLSGNTLSKVRRFRREFASTGKPAAAPPQTPKGAEIPDAARLLFLAGALQCNEVMKDKDAKMLLARATAPGGSPRVAATVLVHALAMAARNAAVGAVLSGMTRKTEAPTGEEFASARRLLLKVKDDATRAMLDVMLLSLEKRAEAEGLFAKRNPAYGDLPARVAHSVVLGPVLRVVYPFVGDGRACWTRASGFFGTALEADCVVYVVDRSGSMVEIFDIVRTEMLTSIGRLGPAQQFHVIFFSKGVPIESLTRALAGATTANKIAAADLMERVRAQGETEPRAAITRAMTVLDQAVDKRKAICLLTDGNFPDNAAVLALVRKLSAGRHVKIHTFLYGRRSPEAVKVMTEIARQSGGQYKFVSSDD